MNKVVTILRYVRRDCRGWRRVQILISLNLYSEPIVKETVLERLCDILVIRAQLRREISESGRTPPGAGKAGGIKIPSQYPMLLGAFAGIAAILTLVGVYGLVAYGVGQRTHEIGIRRALGASAGAVLRLVLRQGLVLTTIGVGVGVAASLAATRILKGLLWGVSPTDPVTFALVAMGLAAAALLACYVPARRALAINPIVALRSE